MATIPLILTALVATTTTGVAALQTPTRALALTNKKDWIHVDVPAKELLATALSSGYTSDPS
jgi:hypothetical protein